MCCSLCVCVFICHTWILAGQMQPSCHMFGSTSSRRKRRRWMGNHQVQAHYIFFDPTNIHIHFFIFNLFTSFSSSTILVIYLLVASCYSDDCTVHSFSISQGVTELLKATTIPYLACRDAQNISLLSGDHLFTHLFIPLTWAECDDSLLFSGASSIPLWYVPFPSTN
jgi:hypothetical protein